MNLTTLPIENHDTLAKPANKTQTMRLRISGLRCAACVQLIEFRLLQVAGIVKFDINIASHIADVEWDADLTSAKKITNAIIDLGYMAFPASLSVDEHERQLQKKSLWQIFVAGFAMMQVMMFAFPAYLEPISNAQSDLSPEFDQLLKLASLVVTIPVIIFSCTGFFSSAWRDIKNRHVGMDVPVSLGILLTFFASVWATFFGGVAYFDSAIMFVFLLLVARYIEGHVQRKTSKALQSLTQLRPVNAFRFLAFGESEAIEQVDAKLLKVGDVLQVPAGEIIPADGLVLRGSSSCDESLMTGESAAVEKKEGDKMFAGTVNLHGVFVMHAERVGNDTQLAALISMMESAATEKPPLVALADRYASHFLAVILCLAFFSGLVWWQIDASRALWVAISVIIVTCPCALSLATPGVMAAAIGKLAKGGVLIAKGRAIESMAQASHFIFDKTGTLTTGELTVDACEAVVTTANQGQSKSDGFESHTLMRIAAAMAGCSQHPVAVALQEFFARENEPTKDCAGLTEASTLELAHVEERPGGGIQASVNGRLFRLGSLRFVQELHDVPFIVPIQMEEQTMTVLGDEHQVLLVFGLTDAIRDDAAATIRRLQEMGKTVLIMSGDRFAVVKRIATQININDFYGEQSPKDKFDKVLEMQKRGAKVVMIGDGMNDGPALSLANASVVMGQGAPLAQSRSDVMLLSNRLLDLITLTLVAKRALSLIRQNIIWALIYNLIAVPAAIAGTLAPWQAALGMTLSSLFVVLNGLRLLPARDANPSPYQGSISQKN